MLQRCRIETYSLDGTRIAYEAVDDSGGPYVKWNDLLPVLWVGREMAKVLETMALSYGPHPKEIQQFLDATKGVE